MLKKKSVAFLLGILICSAIVGWQGARWAKRRHPTPKDPAAFTRTVAGYNVRLIAVAEKETIGKVGQTTRPWTPDGTPRKNSDPPLYGQGTNVAADGGIRREIYFELTPLSEPNSTESKQIKPAWEKGDVFACLPVTENDDDSQYLGATGSASLPSWAGDSKNTSGREIVHVPTTLQFQLGAPNTDSQTVQLGLSRGAFRTIAKGPATMAGLDVGESKTLATGPWGKLTLTRLPLPTAESAPSPTHTVSILDAPFPPTAERKAYFYDSTGKVVVACGVGPHYAASIWEYALKSHGLGDIASYEIKERPYEFAKFDDVEFEAPSTPDSEPQATP